MSLIVAPKRGKLSDRALNPRGGDLAPVDNALQFSLNAVHDLDREPCNFAGLLVGKRRLFPRPNSRAPDVSQRLNHHRVVGKPLGVLSAGDTVAHLLDGLIDGRGRRMPKAVRPVLPGLRLPSPLLSLPLPISVNLPRAVVDRLRGLLGDIILPFDRSDVRIRLRFDLCQFDCRCSILLKLLHMHL